MLAQKGRSCVTSDISVVCYGRIRTTRLLLITVVVLLLGAGLLPPAATGWVPNAEGVPAHQDEPEEITLTLRPEGFDPAEVVRPAGRYMLSVDNRSGVDAVTLI